MILVTFNGLPLYRSLADIEDIHDLGQPLQQINQDYRQQVIQWEEEARHQRHLEANNYGNSASSLIPDLVVLLGTMQSEQIGSFVTSFLPVTVQGIHKVAIDALASLGVYMCLRKFFISSAQCVIREAPLKLDAKMMESFFQSQKTRLQAINRDDTPDDTRHQIDIISRYFDSTIDLSRLCNNT